MSESGPEVELDGSRIVAEAAELSFPRYPGSTGDRRAIAWLGERLGGTGLEIEIEPFSYDVRPAFRAIRALLVGGALLIALAALLAPRAPGAALALVLTALAAGVSLLGWAPWMERIYAGEGPTRTANVAGRRRARGRPRATIVILAHHDSKSQNLTLPWRAALTFSSLAGTVALLGWLAAAIAAGTFPGGAATALGLASASALAALSTLSSGNRSPGAVDNAGSVAILLALARALPARLPPDVEAVFLSPGAEEDHMVGAMRWLDAHREALSGRAVWAINLDGAGNPGRVVLLERFGLGRRFSPVLSAAARRVARRAGIRVRGVWLPPGHGIDAIPFAHRGIDCLTLSSGSLGRATLAIHSAGDRPELLDPATIEEAARLAAGLALELAGQG